MCGGKEEERTDCGGKGLTGGGGLTLWGERTGRYSGVFHWNSLSYVSRSHSLIWKIL